MIPAQTKSSVVPLQHKQELPKLSYDTKPLNVIFRAVYYDQQLHFISKFCLEVMYLKNMTKEALAPDDVCVPAQTITDSNIC